MRMRTMSGSWEHVVTCGLLSLGVLLLFSAETTGQTVSALQVIDSSGRVIGVVVDLNRAARKIGSLVVAVDVSRNGFARSDVNLYFEATDCSGPAYIPDSGSIPRYGTVAGNRMYFEGNPIQTLTLSSVRSIDSNGNAGACVTLAGPFSTEVGPARTFNIANFTVPFDVQ